MITAFTATVTTGFVETRTTTLYSMFGSGAASKSSWFQDVNLTNTGEADLYVAVLQNENAAAIPVDALIIEPGDSRVVPKLNTRWTYVWTEDDAAVNRLEFVAEQLDEFKARYGGI
jgi:hypothetical protein